MHILYTFLCLSIYLLSVLTRESKGTSECPPKNIRKAHLGQTAVNSQHGQDCDSASLPQHHTNIHRHRHRHRHGHRQTHTHTHTASFNWPPRAVSMDIPGDCKVLVFPIVDCVRIGILICVHASVYPTAIVPNFSFTPPHPTALECYRVIHSR